MSVAGVRLADLLAGMPMVDVPASLRDIAVTGLTLDSRRVRKGDAFVALQGSNTHGITFAPAAVASGASVILAETSATAATPMGPEGRATAAADPRFGFAPSSDVVRIPNSESRVPTIWIDHLREQLGELAARFYNRPSETLRVVGVTGTNGKTSTVQLLGHALQHLGARAATIGTLGAGLVGELHEGERTTPDAISVQSLLAEFRDAGASDVAMEVSSHALEQGRVNAIKYAVAVFTNLTRDHLDYHGTMEAYGAAKAKLFTWQGLRNAVINIDDEFGRELADTLPGRVRVLRYGIDNAHADIVARDVRLGTDGIRFTLVTPWGKSGGMTPLLGRFNVANLLALVGCLGALGYTFPQILRALAQAQPVPGRMNRLGGGTQPLIVVDYAHTPDALEQALTSLREHGTGRLICVFGCGGERDQGKRPQMAAIAERLADRVIVTDDNPRGEDGDAIVAQIITGFTRTHTIKRDRAQAIAFALREAQAGDIVLIAGKGHESYQEIAGVKQPFDDVLVARQALETRA